MKKTIGLLVILYCSLLFSFGASLEYKPYIQLLNAGITSQQAPIDHKFICSTNELYNHVDHITDPIKIKQHGLNSNTFKHNSLPIFEALFECFFPEIFGNPLFLLYNNLRI